MVERGDWVKLKSGSPAMHVFVVLHLGEPGKETAICEWLQDDGILTQEAFPVRCLQFTAFRPRHL